MDIKIVKNNEDDYIFYDGTNRIGVARYQVDKSCFMFSQSGDWLLPAGMLMSIVIILRDLDKVKEGVKEYLTTSTQIARQIDIKNKLKRKKQKKAKAKRSKKNKKGK